MASIFAREQPDQVCTGLITPVPSNFEINLQTQMLIWCIVPGKSCAQLPYRFSETFSGLVENFKYQHALIHQVKIDYYKQNLILITSLKILEFIFKYR